MKKLNLKVPIKNIVFLLEKKIINQSNFIKKFGIKKFIFVKLPNKFLDFSFFFILLPITIIIIVIIRLISSLILIRFIKLRSNRLGHFVIETELYLCEKSLKINKPKIRYLDFFFQEDGKVSNKYIKKIIKKKIILIYWRLGKIVQTFNRLISGNLNKFEGKTTNHHDDVDNLFERSEVKLNLPKRDLKKYEKDFEKIGLPINSKFVCILFRDSNYLKKNFEFYNFNYHNYRDTDINTFDLAADYLISKNYYVVRVGKDPEKKMDYKNKKFIDYSFSNYRSDHMDVLLSNKCRFFITTGTGGESLAYIFRKPLLFVNLTNIDVFRTFHKKHIHIFKHYYSIPLKRKLNLEEIFLQLIKIVDSETFKQKQIKLIDNSREEIRDAVIEMDMRLEKNFIFNPEIENLQKLFWQKYDNLLIKTGLRHKHGIKLQARIGSQFLEKNRFYLK